MRKILLILLLTALPGGLFAEWHEISPEGVISQSSVVPASPELSIETVQFDEGAPVPTLTKHVKLNLKGFSKEEVTVNNSSYHRLFVPGWEEQTHEGKPAVPVQITLMEIPRGVMPSVTIKESRAASMNNVYVEPAQTPAIESIDEDPPFVFDETTYSSNTLFPASPLLYSKTVTLMNKSYLEVGLTPFQVNPVTREAVITYELVLEVSFEVPLSSAAPESAGPQKYMILTDDQFAENISLKNFILWKKKKGLEVTLVKTSQINAAGAPPVEEIIQYMRGLSDSAYPDYLLLIGKHDAATGVAASFVKTKYGGYSDLYTACRDDKDFLPDLYYGRMPAGTNEELTLMIDRALEMDRNPVSSAMYNRVIVAGQIQDSDGNNVADRYFCETADLISTYFEQNNYDVTNAIVNPGRMTAEGTWRSSTILWQGASPEAKKIGTRIFNRFVSVEEARNRLNTNINSGVALVQHRDHGAYWGWGDPQYKASDVDLLQNGQNRPLVLSINCSTGSYHRAGNFTTAWLTNKNGGAHGVFAAVDVSYSGFNDWLSHGFYIGMTDNYLPFQRTSQNPDWPATLPDPPAYAGVPGTAQKLGEVMNFGKNYMFQKYGSTSAICKSTFEIFHLFGDPEAAVRIVTPEYLNVSHPSVLSAGVKSVTIETGKKDAKTSLLNNETGEVHVVYADSFGKAQFPLSLTALTPGTLSVTVTAPGCRPYEGVISYTPGETVSLTVLTEGKGQVLPSHRIFVKNSTAEITAEPDFGWEFKNWSGDVTGTAATVQVTMSANKTVTAHFAQLPMYNLNVTKTGMGSVTPANGNYPQNSVLTLKATPDAGWRFVKWTGDIVSTAQELSLTINGNKNINALFEKIPTYTLTVNITGRGTVYPSERTFMEGTSVDVTAIPDFGWNFDKWTGDLAGTGSTQTIVMNGNKTINAVFTEQVIPVDPNATGVPATPNLTSNTWGFERDFSLIMNMWWGNNGTLLKIYENGILMKEEKIPFNSPSQQTYTLNFTGKAPGTYVYTCELINQHGVSTSGEFTKVVQ